MSKLKVLIVSQEINPFLPKSELSVASKKIPQAIQDLGKEVRLFMPRFGSINERRHQLHEVIRLSGLNLVINDTDHPLIIKVASVPGARMQTYFIDSESYFKRKATLVDENEAQFEDNDERSMFFARGVLETVKKLGWKPDIIHCHGYFSSLVPLYIKKYYGDDPHYENAKIVTSLYDTEFDGAWNKEMASKLTMDGFAKEDISNLEDPTYINLCKESLSLSDGVVYGSENISEELKQYVNSLNVETLNHGGDEINGKHFSEFYDKIAAEVLT